MQRTGLTILALVAAAVPVAAQTTPPSASHSEVTISAGYEAHRDHLQYTFENPSTINTPFLVPHNFVQTYVANNHWLVAAARYPAFGGMMATDFGVTPERATFASDLDTFFNPDNDVIVSGTAGDVSMHSLRVAQWSEGRLWGAPVRVGYVYRQDVTEFHSTERLVTHSNPPSATRTPINTHETTFSRVHEVPIGTWRDAALTPRWRVTAGADMTPLVLARLTTILPEKYPGQEILFVAKAAALAARAEITWQRRHPIVFTAHYDRTWSYRASARFSRSALQVGARVEFRP